MNNINPSIWGRSGWIFLHCIAHAYPDNPSNSDKTTFYKFFISIKDVLPCEKCRINYIDHLKMYPLNDKALSSKNNLIEWFTNIRNASNKEINKPAKTLGEYQRDMVENVNKTPNYKNMSYFLAIIIALLLIILSVLVCKNYFKH